MANFHDPYRGIPFLQFFIRAGRRVCLILLWTIFAKNFPKNSQK